MSGQTRAVRACWLIGAFVAAVALIFFGTRVGWWWAAWPVGAVFGAAVRSRVGRFVAVPTGLIAGVVAALAALLVGHGLSGVERVSSVAGELAGLGSGSGATLAVVALALTTLLCGCGAWVGAALVGLLASRRRPARAVPEREEALEPAPVPAAPSIPDNGPLVPQAAHTPHDLTPPRPRPDPEPVGPLAHSLVGADEARRS